MNAVGIDPIQVTPLLVKQNLQSQRSLLLNYESLEAHFKSTRFGWFFSDESPSLLFVKQEPTSG